MATVKETVNIPIQSDVPLKYTLVVNVPAGQQLTGRAYMRVFSAVGDFIYGTWDAALINNTFVWNVPHDMIRYLEHGARYRIYMEQVGEQDRVIAQSGKLYWSND